MNLTFLELLDLKELIAHVEKQSRERICQTRYINRHETSAAWRFTDSSIFACRVLPVLKKLYNEVNREASQRIDPSHLNIKK